MWVYLYPNNTETELKNAYIGEYHTQTFDFQNDWDLGWTGISLYWTPSYVSWEWWTIGWSNSDSQSYIVPPSSIYDGKTLKKVKIWLYKGVTTNFDGIYWYSAGWGIISSSWNHQATTWSQAGRINYDQVYYYDWSTWNTMRTVDLTWELELEWLFDDNSTTFIINGNSYNLGNISSWYRWLWTNSTLSITVANWRTANSNIYIRKVQIETA